MKHPTPGPPDLPRTGAPGRPRGRSTQCKFSATPPSENARLPAWCKAMPIRKKRKSFPSSFSIYFPTRLFPLKIYSPFAVQTLHLLTLRFLVQGPVSESQHKVKDLSQGLRTVFLVHRMSRWLPSCQPYALCTFWCGRASGKNKNDVSEQTNSFYVLWELNHSAGQPR